MAQAAARAPRRREPPFPLHVGVAVLDEVVLVAPERTLRPELVHVPAAALVEAIEIGADRHGEGPLAAGDRPRPSKPDAAVAAVEVDDAARAERRVPRLGQELHDGPRAAVEPGLHGVLAGEGQVVDRAELGLAHALARVEDDRRGIHLPGIGLELRAAEPERILRVGLVEAVGHECQPAPGRRRGELRVELVARGGAVVAVAVGAEARDPGDVIEVALLSPELQPRLARAVGAGERRRAEGGLGRTVRREDLHHAARGVAVEAREGPPQDLDPVGRGQVERRGLALSVGHRRGDPVGDEAHAAHAEGGAAAEAARGHLQVLRVVLAVLDHDARHAAQELREIDLDAILAGDAGVHAVDGRGHLEGRLRHAGGRDHDVRDAGLGGCRQGLGRRRRRGSQHRQGSDRASRPSHGGLSAVPRGTRRCRRSRDRRAAARHSPWCRRCRDARRS